MTAAGPRPPWLCDVNRCSESRPRVTTRVGRRSPRRGAPRRLLASLSLGANCSPTGGSAAAELANEAASVGVLSFSGEARRFDDRTPLRVVGGENAAEFFWRSRRGIHAELRQTFGDVGRLQRLIETSVQQVDDRFRCLRGRKKTE